MSKNKPIFYIDSRETKGSKLVSLVEDKLKKQVSLSVERKWLEIGDYVINDICFEAKSVIDFINSVQNKRIWNQIDNMDRHYKNNFVIIYGDLKQGIKQILEKSNTKTSPQIRAIMYENKFMSAIGRISLDTDTQVMWVKDEVVASNIIVTIAKMQKYQRDIIQPQLIKRITTDDLRLDVLTCIKGISIKKAKLLIKRFGSIMEIGEQTVEEIQQIEGIGETLAQRILQTLNSEREVKI